MELEAGGAESLVASCAVLRVCITHGNATIGARSCGIIAARVSDSVPYMCNFYDSALHGLSHEIGDAKQQTAATRTKRQNAALYHTF